MRTGLFLFRLGAAASLTLAASALTASCTTVIVISPCEDGLAECDGLCFDLETDDDHCGACDNGCGPEASCVSGACVPVGSCDPPLAECAGSCVDLQSDPNHCGGCFSECDQFCTFGECAETCPPGLTECFGGCVDTTSDEFNCGGCENFCPDGWQCLGSQCTPNPTCDDPLCGFFCEWTDLPSSTAFSVEGFNSFDQPSFYEPTCAQTQSPESAFVFFAPESGLYAFDTLGSSIDTVLEVRGGGCQPIGCDDDTFDLASQVIVELFEGELTTIVVDGFSGGEFVLNGTLVQDCPPGLTQCGGACVDTLSDPQHCGECFSPCGPDGSCVMGFCEVSCLPSSCGTCSGEVDLGSTVPQTFNGTVGTFANGFQPFCGEGFGSEVGHTFTAPTSGTYMFSATGMIFPVVTFMNEFCEESACFESGSGSVSLSAGETVIVVVDSDAGPGPYSLAVSQAPPPSCPTGDLGSSVPVTISGSTVGGTSQFTPTCVNSNAPDHQYTFTPSVSGNYRISTAGSSFDTVLHVLGGTCGGPSLACNDDFMGSLQAQLTINLTAGVPVTIVMDGFSGAGNYQLSVQLLGMPPPPPPP